MTASEVRKSPVYSLGAGLTETVLRSLKVAQGPTVTWVASDFTDSVATTVDLFHVPAGTFVIDMIVKKSVAWTGTGNVFIIGDSDDTDRYFTSAVFVSTDAGVVRANQACPFQYLSSDPRTIYATITTSSGTGAGTFIPYLIYSEAVSE